MLQKTFWILWLCHYAQSFLDPSYRIPKTVIPIRYFLTMEPAIENVQNASSTFNGSVTIELKTLAATSNVTLHSNLLNITESSISVSNSNGAEIGVKNNSYDEARQFFIINLETPLEEDEYYNLTIAEFSGKLQFDNVGFYLAKYQNTKGEERHIALTDFEPSDARKAFPCFDQPDLKAKFNIRLIRPEGFHSVANEIIVSTEDLGHGRFMDSFKETVIMPTYVVAFVVSDLKHTATEERHRIFARPQAVDGGQLDFALAAAVELLPILENFTGVDYANTKMDMFAIPPAYFGDEAMENWGLVTFSEYHLFINNETSSPADVQRCVTYIAHEFGHQWFGNLVTFKDWKYLWLSEGFGAYLQYYIASLYKPEWRLMDQYLLETLHRVFDSTREVNDEPMNHEPEEIGAIPSPYVCYFKASTVIRMTEAFLTNQIFRRGLQIYLDTNKFCATEPNDLYQAYQQAIEEADAHYLVGNHSVLDILQTWDSNLGYPLVTLSRNYETGDVLVSQTRYLHSGYNDTIDDDGTDPVWYIPISFASSHDRNFSDTSAEFWLSEKNMTIKGLTAMGWFLINKHQTGVYRVNYDTTNWNRIAAFLNTDDFDDIHVTNRAQLLYDAFNFAKLGFIPYEIPLNLSKYLVRETDYIAITPFSDALDHLDTIMSASNVYDLFKNHIVSALSAAFDHLGFDEKPTDTHLDRLNRAKVHKCMCKAGHSGFQQSALKKFREWKETGILATSPDLEWWVLCGAMKNAPLEDWSYLYRQIPNLPRDKSFYYVMALTCSENPEIINGFLERVYQNESLIEREERLMLRKIGQYSVVGLNVALKFIKKHPVIPNMMKTMLRRELSTKITTQEQLETYNLLLDTNEVHDDDGAIWQYGMMSTQDNLDWIGQGFKKEIEEWLLDYNAENIEKTNMVLITNKQEDF